MLGCLFENFINLYDYWGWTDIDMIMGNVDNDIDYNFDVVSYGFNTFGPITLFKTSLTHLYKQIDRYGDIIKDEYICKEDAMTRFFTEFNKVENDVLINEKTKTKNKYIYGTIIVIAVAILYKHFR